MQEPLVVTFNEGPDLTFRKWSDVSAFVDEHIEIHLWLVSTLSTAGFDGLAGNLSNAKNELANRVNNESTSGNGVAGFSGFAAYFRDRGPFFYKGGRQWGAIARARELGGDRAGAFAYAVTVGAQISHASTRSDVIGMVTAAFPELADPHQLGTRLAAERANFRSSLSRRIADYESLVERQQEEWRQLLGSAMHRSRRTFRRRIQLWNDQQRTRDEASDAALASIRNTEATYREFMRLRAPVEYWLEEANRHSVRRSSASTRLSWFFPIISICLVICFWIAAKIIIGVNPSDRPVAQILVGGAMVALSTIAFWIGRILTKLYLSEHHLEQDATQRAVMTTTYLALLDQGGATADADRSAILAALFRSTPDGIVKEDGPSDALGLAGLLAKAGVR